MEMLVHPWSDSTLSPWGFQLVFELKFTIVEVEEIGAVTWHSKKKVGRVKGCENSSLLSIKRSMSGSAMSGMPLLSERMNEKKSRTRDSRSCP